VQGGSAHAGRSAEIWACLTRTMAPSWRDDPRWYLVEWDIGFWNSAPKHPSSEAELTGGGAWCAHFVEGRAVATWALAHSPLQNRWLSDD
jgi:hypothetical protein